MKIHICTFGILFSLIFVQGKELSGDARLAKKCLQEAGMPEGIFDEYKDEDFKIEHWTDLLKIISNLLNPKITCLFACYIKGNGGLKGGKVNGVEEMELIQKNFNVSIVAQNSAEIIECANIVNEKENECEVFSDYLACSLMKIGKKNLVKILLENQD